MTTILTNPEPQAPPCNSCEGPMAYAFSDRVNAGARPVLTTQQDRPVPLTHWFWCDACQQMWRLTPDGGLLRDHIKREP